MKKETILNETERGLKIFQYVLYKMNKQHLIVTRDGRCKTVRNPFYRDNNPSLSIYYNTERECWCFNDFGNQDYRGDAFDFAARYFGLDVKANFVEILQKLSVELKEFKPMFNINHNYNEYSKPNRNRYFKINEIPFSEVGELFFLQFGINTDTLINCDVVQISGYETENSNGEIYRVEVGDDKIMFAYKKSWGAKIYTPYPKEFRYIGNKPKSYIFKNDLIEDFVEGQTLILTGGEKDVLTLGALGVPAFCLSSETEPLTIGLVRQFYKQGYQIKLMLDCDSTGIEKMLQTHEQLKLPILDLSEIIPTEFKSKITDVSEYIFEGLSKDELIAFINSIEVKEIIVKTESDISNQPINETISNKLVKNDNEQLIQHPSTTVIKRPEISFTSASDLIEEVGDEPDMTFLWKGIPLTRCFGVIVGPSKSGKTILCESLAYSIAGNQETFLDSPLNNKKLKVMLISLEEHYRHRAKRHKKQHLGTKGWSDVSVSDNITVIRDGFPNYMNTQEDWEYMKNQILKSKCRMVIIDSLTRLYCGKIEESQVGQQVCERLRSLAYELGLILIVIHHTTKQYGKQLTIDSIAGSRIIAQESDFALGVNKNNSGTRYVKEIFSRYREESYDAIEFEINNDTNLVEFVRNASEEEILFSKKSTENEDINHNLLLDFIKEKSKEGNDIEHKDLMEEFVETKIMKQVTLQKQLTKLIDGKKIIRLIRGRYKLL